MMAYTLRKSERFCLAMYSCLSSCSFNANYNQLREPYFGTNKKHERHSPLNEDT